MFNACMGCMCMCERADGNGDEGQDSVRWFESEKGPSEQEDIESATAVVVSNTDSVPQSINP